MNYTLQKSGSDVVQFGDFEEWLLRLLFARYDDQRAFPISALPPLAISLGLDPWRVIKDALYAAQDWEDENELAEFHQDIVNWLTWTPKETLADLFAQPAAMEAEVLFKLRQEACERIRAENARTRSAQS